MREVKKDLSESERLAEADARAAACVAMDEGNLAAATAPVRGSVLRAGPNGLILDAMVVCVCSVSVRPVKSDSPERSSLGTRSGPSEFHYGEVNNRSLAQRVSLCLH